MLFLNPNDFEGCESSLRINIAIMKTYTAHEDQYTDEQTIRFEIEVEVYIYWYFNSLENRDKAIEKIDKICEKQAGVLQQIASNLDNIESSL